MNFNKLAFFSIILAVFSTKTLASNWYAITADLLCFLCGNLLEFNDHIEEHPTTIVSSNIQGMQFEKDQTENSESESTPNIPSISDFEIDLPMDFSFEE